MDNFIQVKGNLNPVNFMNKIANKINDKFDCFIEEKKYSLKFNIIFEGEENIEIKKEIPKEIQNELNILGINFEDKINEDDELGINKRECIIQVTLFEKNEKEYLLRFNKENGELEDYYYKNILKIIKIIKSF